MFYEDELEQERQGQQKAFRRQALEAQQFAKDLCQAQRGKASSENLVRLWEQGKTGEIIAIAHAEAGLERVMGLFRTIQSNYESKANHVDTREPVRLRGFRQKYEILKKGVARNVAKYLAFRLAEEQNASLAQAAYEKDLFILRGVPGNIREMSELAGTLHYTKEHCAWCEEIGMTPDGQIAKASKKASKAD
jgi:hypothetical protein